MQKETKTLLLTAVGAFFSGVLVTFLILCLAVAMVRPCHKEMPPMPTHAIHRPDFTSHVKEHNQRRDFNRAPRLMHGEKRHIEQRPPLLPQRAQ